jgi:AcrR family transcriptional regulator
VPTQAERTEATRARLIATARRLFAEKGFAGTSTEEILSEASVSRGALYHHFPSKTDLFQATFEAVEDDLTDQVMTAAGTTSDPKRMLERGFDAFLDQCRNPEVQRIVMIDGATVLGWDTWHAVMQAGMVVARADDPAGAKRAMTKTFARIIAAL